jgi:integrase
MVAFVHQDYTRRFAILDWAIKARAIFPTRWVFPSPEGTILDRDNLYHRYFLPVLAKAGIRKIRLHDLRHTFGSLLIQAGGSLTYVKEQMGHSSIQVTVDIYGHLIPGSDVAFVDRLDPIPANNPKTNTQQSAT